MIIEAVSGTSYKSFLADHIFGPLGMSDTMSRDHEQSEIEGLAVGYRYAKKRFLKIAPVLRLGGGSLVSTVQDLVKWDAALNTEKLVSKATLEQIWTPQMLNDGTTASLGNDNQGRDYAAGFGWFIGDEHNRGLVHHSGGVDGYAAHIDRYRNEGITIITMCNIERGAPTILAGNLAAHFFKYRK